MRVNIDLTKTNSNNDISDELYNNVGASAFNLVHDFFYGSTDLEIWTGAGQTGTQLVETTDYDLGGIDTDLTTRAGVNIYSTVTVTNVTYQTGDLYITYHACADFIDALDRYKVVRSDGNSWELTSGNAFEVYTTGGWQLIDDLGQAGYLWSSAGQVLMRSKDGLITIEGSGTGGADLRTTGSGNIRLYTGSSTDANAIDISATNGGIDIDSVGDTVITATGVGADITLKSVIAGAGTGGNLTLQTQTTDVSGTSGNVIIGQASGPGPAGNIQISTENNTSAAIDINATDGGIDIDAGGTSYFTVTSGDLNIETTGGGDIIIDATTGAGSVSLSAPAGSISIANTGAIDITSGVGTDVTIASTGVAGEVVINSPSTAANAIDIESTDGGIDIDAETSIGLTLSYGGTGAAGDITVEAVTAAAATTPPDISIVTYTFGSAVAGDITIQSTGSGAQDSGDILVETNNAAGSTNGNIAIRATGGSGGTAGNITIEATTSGGAAGYTELLGHVKIPATSTAPTSPTAGSIYFDDATDILYIYNGTGWVSVTLT